MVFQEYNLVERLSVMENVLSGRLGYVSAWRAWLRKFPRRTSAAPSSCSTSWASATSPNRRADALSGGSASASASPARSCSSPKLLLADEPTSSLDPKTSVEIMELMADLAQFRAIPVIVNMHDVELRQALRRPHRRHVGRQVVFDGPPARLERRRLTTIYGGEGWLH